MRLAAGGSGGIEIPEPSGICPVGWTDPKGMRPNLGALLLGYYTDDGK